jgi:deoxyribodipyrimidine photolyase
VPWFRRDLRLGDHPALLAAGRTGYPIVDAGMRQLLAEGANGPGHICVPGPVRSGGATA